MEIPLWLPILGAISGLCYVFARILSADLVIALGLICGSLSLLIYQVIYRIQSPELWVSQSFRTSLTHQTLWQWWNSGSLFSDLAEYIPLLLPIGAQAKEKYIATASPALQLRLQQPLACLLPEAIQQLLLGETMPCTAGIGMPEVSRVSPAAAGGATPRSTATPTSLDDLAAMAARHSRQSVTSVSTPGSSSFPSSTASPRVGLRNQPGSGGEPFSYAGLLMTLLQRQGSAGISACVDAMSDSISQHEPTIQRAAFAATAGMAALLAASPEARRTAGTVARWAAVSGGAASAIALWCLVAVPKIRAWANAPASAGQTGSLSRIGAGGHDPGGNGATSSGFATQVSAWFQRAPASQRVLVVLFMVVFLRGMLRAARG